MSVFSTSVFSTSPPALARFLMPLLVVLQVAFAAPAAAQTRDFAAALASVPAGGVLSLPGGDWGTLALRGTGPLVIRSADPSDPAVFSRMLVKDVEGLRLENLSLKYDWSRDDKIRVRPFEIIESRDVTLSGLRIAGDVARAGPATDRGFPWGIGLSIQYSRDVTLENSEITAFHRGIAVRGSDGVTILDNDIHGLRMDGLNFAAVQDVRIVGNHIHDFARSMDSKDHSDMIQFWTNKTDRPNTGIVIRDNVLNSGQGGFTQSIFMRNEEVDRGRAGPEMFYRDVLIEGNVIVNAHRHGITLGASHDVTIRGNTLVHNTRSAGDDTARDLWLPRISVADTSQDVVVEGNIAAHIPDPQSGWRVTNNLVVQPHARMEPGFYGQVFADVPQGDPADPASYAPRPGGPADRPGLGAARLRAR